jgi:hypothetical protein
MPAAAATTFGFDWELEFELQTTDQQQVVE